KRKRYAYRYDAGKQRCPCAPRDAREHVAPDLVGAEQVHRGWRLSDRSPACLQRVVGSEPWGTERDDDEHDDHPEAKKRRAAPRETAQHATSRGRIANDDWFRRGGGHDWRGLATHPRVDEKIGEIGQ